MSTILGVLRHVYLTFREILSKPNKELILVWDVQELGHKGLMAARITDLIEDRCTYSIIFPVRVYEEEISIATGPQVKIDTLSILTPEMFLKRFPDPGRVPNPGEIMRELHPKS